MADNGYYHLFAYSPVNLPFTRLTNGLWDDTAPSLSPDGTKLAFASNRNQYWDLYQLDLQTGQVSRLTDSPSYENNPAWSPDSQWIVYEEYVEDNLEIFILSMVNPGQAPIRLTQDAGVDQYPAWSPGGRQIAFSSNRSGDDEIWLANLDTPGEGRFINISQSAETDESHPAWSPDGTRLAWESTGLERSSSIYLWDASQPSEPARYLAAGGWPAWNEQGSQIAVRIPAPNQNHLLAYTLDGTITMPSTPIETLRGLAWRIVPINALAATFARAAEVTPSPPWQEQIQLITDLPNQRASVVKLADVEAPHPYLHDAVDEAFYALRARLIAETNWDILANLENAYAPITSSLDPGLGDSWLYTGRAFALNPIPLNVGWMYINREEHNGQTWWRVFVRAQAQDGSQGEPLRHLPWDLSARYNLNPLAYEQGGAPIPSAPTGYWIDFTDLALQHGWQRLPALTTWRTYFKGAQFNQFVIPGGKTWREAMLELYPPEVLVTPTIIIPPTRTPSPTPTGYRYKTPTPTPTSTPSMLPTYTPAP
jgi:TolB protein